MALLDFNPFDIFWNTSSQDEQLMSVAWEWDTIEWQEKQEEINKEREKTQDYEKQIQQYTEEHSDETPRWQKWLSFVWGVLEKANDFFSGFDWTKEEEQPKWVNNFQNAKNMYEAWMLSDEDIQRRKQVIEAQQRLQNDQFLQWVLSTQKELIKSADNLTAYKQELDNIKESWLTDEKTKQIADEYQKKYNGEQKKYLLNLYKFWLWEDEYKKQLEQLWEDWVLQNIQKEVQRVWRDKWSKRMLEKWQEYLKPLQSIYDYNTKIKEKQDNKYKNMFSDVLKNVLTTRWYVPTDNEIKTIADETFWIIDDLSKEVQPDDSKRKLWTNIIKNITTNVLFDDWDKLLWENATKEDYNKIKSVVDSIAYKKFTKWLTEYVLQHIDNYIWDDWKINYEKLWNDMQSWWPLYKYVYDYKEQVNRLIDEQYLKQAEDKYKNAIWLAPKVWYWATNLLKKANYNLKYDNEAINEWVISNAKNLLKSSVTPFGLQAYVYYWLKDLYDKFTWKKKNEQRQQFRWSASKVWEMVKDMDPKLKQDLWRHFLNFFKYDVWWWLMENPVSSLVDLWIMATTLWWWEITKIPKIAKWIEWLEGSISLLKNSYVRKLANVWLNIWKELINDLPMSLMVDWMIRTEPSFWWYVWPNIWLWLVKWLKLRDAWKVKRWVLDSLNWFTDDILKWKSVDEIAKWIQGSIVENWVWYIWFEDVKNILERDWWKLTKQAKKDIAKQVESNLNNFLLKDDKAKIDYINRQLVKDKIASWELKEKDITSILDSMKNKYWDYINNMRKQWVKDSDIVVNLLNMENKTMAHILERWNLGKINNVIKDLKLKLPKKIDKKFDELWKWIEKLRETNPKAYEVIWKDLEDSLKTLKSKAYAVQALAYSDNWMKYLQDLNENFQKLNNKLSEYWVEVWIKKFNLWDIKWIEDVYDISKIGNVDNNIWKIFDDLQIEWVNQKLDEWLKEIKWDEWYKSFQNVMKIVDWIHKWKISIYDIPENYRKWIQDLMWMFAQTKDWHVDILWKTSEILSDFLKWKINIQQSKSVIDKVVKSFDEIFYGSIKDNIKANLLNEIWEKVKIIADKVWWIENITPWHLKEILPYTSSRVAKKVLDALKRWDTEYLLRQMISNSFIDNLFFNKTLKTTAEKNTWNIAMHIVTEFSDVQKRISLLVDNFVTWFEVIKKLDLWKEITENIRSLEEFKNILWYAFYKKTIWNSKKLFDFIESSTEFENIVKKLDEESKTFYMWVEAMRIWEIIPSVSRTIDYIESEMSVEELAKVLPVNYIKHPQIQKELADNLSSEQMQKVYKTLQLAEKRHTQWLYYLNKLYDEATWMLRTQMEIDWKTIRLSEVLNMIDPNITNLNYWYLKKTLHFASQDILKYIKEADPEKFEKLFNKYVKWVYNDLSIVKVTTKNLDSFMKSLFDITWPQAYEKIFKDVENVLLKLTDKKTAYDILSRMMTDVWWYFYRLDKTFSVDSIMSDVSKTSYDAVIDFITRKMIKSNLDNSSRLWNILSVNKYKEILEKLWEPNDLVKEIMGSVKWDAFKFIIHNAQYNAMVWLLHWEILRSIDEIWDFINIWRDNFVLMLWKFSRERRKITQDYLNQIIWKWEFKRLWIELNPLSWNNTPELLNEYKRVFQENADELRNALWEAKYNMITKEIDDLLEKWYTKWFDDYMKQSLEEKRNVYQDTVDSVDMLMDKVSADEFFQYFVKTLNKYENYMLDFDFRSIKATDTIFNDKDFKNTLKWILDEFKSIQNLIVNSKDFWVKLSSMIKDWWFDYLFDANWVFKIVEKWWDKTYVAFKWWRPAIEQVKYFDIVYNNISEVNETVLTRVLKWVVNKLSNLQTVTKYDPELVDIISKWERWKRFKFPVEFSEWLKNVLISMWDEFKKITHINTKEAIRQIVWKLEEWILNNKIDIAKIKNDIIGWYEYKYVWLKSTYDLWNVWQIWWVDYKDLIDAYVDIFKVIRKKFARDMFTVDDLRKYLDKAFNSFNDYKWVFWLKSAKQIDMERLHSLYWNRIWSSVNDLAKIKNRKELLYNDKMFFNYLFNTLADAIHTDKSSVKNIVHEVLKSVEKISATWMFTMFYNFITWAPAASQQIVQNELHRLAIAAWNDLMEMDISWLDDIMKLFSDLSSFSVMKSVRPEFAQWVLYEEVAKWLETFKWIIKDKAFKALQKTSALTYADAAFEDWALRLWLMSALIEHWYTREWAETLFQNILKTVEDFQKKWYWEYIDYEYMAKLSENNLREYLTKKLYDLWIQDIWKQTEIIEDIVKMRKQLWDLYPLMKNAEMKSMIFFQLSKSTALNSNQLLWKDWWRMFFRFMSWASKKAWEYATLLYKPLIMWDTKWLYALLKQMAANAMYTSKIYWYMDRIINWNTNWDWVDPYSFVMQMYLPMVVFNMTSYNLLDAVGREIVDPNKMNKYKWNLMERIFNSMVDVAQWAAWRWWLSIAYWLWQYMKTRNWLSLIEKQDMENEVSKEYTNNFLNVLTKTLQEAFMSRLTKYNVTRANWIVMDSAVSPLASIFSYISNAKIFKSQTLIQDIYSAWYDILRTEDQDAWLSWIAKFFKKLFPNQINYKYAYLALQEYLDKNWLQWYLRWFNQRTIVNKFDELEQMIDNKSFNDYIEKQEWIAPSIELEKELKWWRLEWNTKVFKFVTAMLNPSKWNTRQKWLRRIGAWVDEEAFKKYKEDYKKVSTIIDQMLTQYIWNDIKKLKKFKLWTTEYEKYLKDKTEIFINKRWNAIVYKAFLDEARKKFAVLAKERLKNKYWNIKTEAYKKEYNMMMKNFEMNLIAKNYNSILALNQEIWIWLMQLYADNDEEYPLKNKLSWNSWIAKATKGRLYEDIASRQWLFSSNINTIYSYVISKLWWYVKTAVQKEWDENKKKELREKFGDFVIWTVKQLDKQYWKLNADNVRVWIAANLVDYLEDLVKNAPKVVKELWDSFEKRLDIVHVTNDVKITDAIPELWELQEIWKWWRKRKPYVRVPSVSIPRLPHVNMRRIADKLNTWRDLWNARRIASWKLPYVNWPDYRLHWWYIRAIRTPNIKAKKPKIKLDFVKILAPEQTKTIDLTVAKEKRVKTVTKYRPKKIKTSKLFRKVIKR